MGVNGHHREDEDGDGDEDDTQHNCANGVQLERLASSPFKATFPCPT